MNEDEKKSTAVNGGKDFSLTVNLESFLSELEEKLKETEDEKASPEAKKSDEIKKSEISEKQKEKETLQKQVEKTTADAQKSQAEVVDLMTDASTSEKTGNLPSSAEIAEASEKDKNEKDAAVDAAIEKLVTDTVGSVDIANNLNQEQAQKKDGEQAAKESSQSVKADQKPAPAAAVMPAASGEAGSGSQDEEAKPKKKMKLSVKIGLGLLTVLLIGLLGYYGYQAYYFHYHFFPNTTINEVNAAELGVDEVEAQIKEAAEVYSMNVKFRNELTETFTGEDIDYTYTASGEVTDIMNHQNILLWPYEITQTHEYKVKTPLSFDEDLLNQIIDKMPEMNPDQMIAPADAYVDFVDTEFKVVDQVIGTTIPADRFKEALKEAVATGQTEFDVDKEGLYTSPAVWNTDQTLIDHCNELNNFTKGSVTLTMPSGRTYTLDAKVTKDWLVADENGMLTKDAGTWHDHLVQWVSDLADEVDSVGEAQEFPATGIGLIEVESSDYGYAIDEEAEVEKLTQELEEGTQESREPVWAVEAFADYNYGFGGDYVEVDASRQHVWLYIDGDCVFDTDCVTGLMTTEKYTPSGIFQIYYCQSPATLRGEMTSDGNYSYETQVQYWMPFNGGIGLHDATWQSYFGSDRYTYAGSHGCVNLPYDAAATIYSYAYSGLPVIVYYSEGCEFE